MKFKKQFLTNVMKTYPNTKPVHKGEKKTARKLQEKLNQGGETGKRQIGKNCATLRERKQNA